MTKNKPIVLFLIILSVFIACSHNDEPTGGSTTLNPPVKLDFNGHDAVLMVDADGDLPALYFASCNIGAESESDYGLYFWWGDTIGHTYEDKYSFSYSNDEITTYGFDNKTMYNLGILSDPSEKGNLTPKFDAASVLWGGNWRMPTKRDWERLINNCTWTRYAESDVHRAGYMVTRKDKKGEIFLPDAGYIHGSSHKDATKSGHYWSSSPYKYSENAYYMNISYSNHSIGDNYRYYGLSIRPVASIDY